MTKAWMFAGGLLATVVAVPAHAQAVRHYDCSKAGNANKAACKSAAAVVPAPKPTSVANPNACRDATGHFVRCGVIGPISGPTRAPSAPVSTNRRYDCSKAGNANKVVCKGVVAPAAPAPAVVSGPARSAAPVAGQNTHPGGPNGATAKCRDGSLSFSAHRSGSCSGHGGVGQWY